MKIKITFTVDVDSDAWANEYGLDPKDVRKDVQNYYAVAAIEDIDSRGLGKGHPEA